MTQSAVSKRSASLQDERGFEVIERDSQRARLTAAGYGLAERANPLLAELRHAISGQRADRAEILSVGVSEAVLSSWAAIALADACMSIPGPELTLNAHHSPVAGDCVWCGDPASSCVPAIPTQWGSYPRSKSLVKRCSSYHLGFGAYVCAQVADCKSSPLNPAPRHGTA